MLRLFLILCLIPPLLAHPAKWEKDILKYEERDLQTPFPIRENLFIGSSSIRLWDLKKSFPDHFTLNRGFGGSQIEDAIHFADRIIFPYLPKAIFFYAGDNDIKAGKSAEQVVALYQKFTAKIHAALPNTEIIWLPIKPSRARWNLWPEMNQANLAIQNITSKNPKLHYLDIPSEMLKTGQPPAADLFKKDGLHLSEKGMEIWTDLVSHWLTDY